MGAGRSARLPSIDGIRAVCILLVVGGHASRGEDAQWLDYVFHGGLGVRIFFVISGFLIGSLLLRERLDTGTVGLGNFYARRVVRLLPAYLAFVVALVALDAWTRLDLSACGYATMLTFTKNYGCAVWIDAHLWSLSVEEQFYLLAAPLAALLRPRALVIVAAASLFVAPLGRVLSHYTGWAPFEGYSLLVQVDALGAGVILAFLVTTRPETLKRALLWRPTAIRVAALVAIYVVWVMREVGLFGHFFIPLGATIQSVAAAYLIGSYALVPAGLGFRLLNLRPMIWLGLISYSVYLWQQVFFAAPGYFAEGDAWLLSPPVNIVLAIAAGAVSSALFERPFFGLRARLRRSARIEPEPAPSEAVALVLGPSEPVRESRG